MKLQLKNLSHHAYCLVGNDVVHDELISVLEKTHKIETQGNPDLFDRKYQVFNVDDAREVKSSAGMRPVGEGGKKIFILTMNSVTSEAQNALLKLLEEPADYAHFFLVIPSTHLLLPTVKSRLSFIETGEEEKAVTSEEATEFLSMNPAKRIEFIKGLLEDVSDEKRSKREVIDFLNDIEGMLYKKGLKKNQKALESIAFVRKYVDDRAPSLKMLLEYVAMNV